MTLRRLAVLLHALPYGSPLHEAIWAAEEAAKVAKPDEIRARQAAWERRNAERLAKEEAP